MMPLTAGWYWVEEDDVVVEEDCMVGNEERGYVKSGEEGEEIVGWVGEGSRLYGMNSGEVGHHRVLMIII